MKKVYILKLPKMSNEEKQSIYEEFKTFSHLICFGCIQDTAPNMIMIFSERAFTFMENIKKRYPKSVEIDKSQIPRSEDTVIIGNNQLWHDLFS